MNQRIDPNYQQPDDEYHGPPASIINENEPEEQHPGPQPIKPENCDVNTTYDLDPQRSSFLNWVSPIQQKDKEEEQILVQQLKQEPNQPIKLECPVCSRSFKDKYGLEKHVKFFHSDETPHQCTECSKAFKQVGHLIDKHQCSWKGHERLQLFVFARQIIVLVSYLISRLF